MIELYNVTFKTTTGITITLESEKSNQECLESRRQTDETITRVLVNISLCAKAYLIVRYRPQLIKSEWPNTACQITTKEMLKTKFIPQNSWKLFLCSKKLS